MSPDEVVFLSHDDERLAAAMSRGCGGLPPRSFLAFSQFVHKFVGTSDGRICTVTAFFSIEIKKGFQSHIHFTKGQCSKGDTYSFRHEGPKRGGWTPKTALHPEPRTEKMDKSSRRKSPCAAVPLGS